MADQVPQVTPDETKEKFDDKMKELALKAREQEVERTAATVGVPYINLKGFPVSPEALSLIAETQAREKNVVCFFYAGSEFRVAALNPKDLSLIHI